MNRALNQLKLLFYYIFLNFFFYYFTAMPLREQNSNRPIDTIEKKTKQKKNPENKKNKESRLVGTVSSDIIFIFGD